MKKYGQQNIIPHYIARDNIEYKSMNNDEIKFRYELYTPLGVNRKSVENRIEYILNSIRFSKNI